MKNLICLLFLVFSFQAGATEFYAAPVTGTAGVSAKVLNQNNLRNYLLIQNLGATNIIAKFGSAISSSNEGVVIVAGGNYEPIVAPGNSLYLKAASGSPTYVVIEGN